MRLHNTTDNWNNMLAKSLEHVNGARDAESQPLQWDDRFFSRSKAGKSLLKWISMKGVGGASQPQLRLGVSCLAAVTGSSQSLLQLLSSIQRHLEPLARFNSWLEPLNINFGFEKLLVNIYSELAHSSRLTSTAVRTPTKPRSLFDWEPKKAERRHWLRVNRFMHIIGSSKSYALRSRADTIVNYIQWVNDLSDISSLPKYSWQLWLLHFSVVAVIWWLTHLQMFR